MKLQELDLNKTYTYADYLKWYFEERIELIKGKIFKMSPAPNTYHQLISGNLFLKIRAFFKENNIRPTLFPELTINLQTIFPEWNFSEEPREEYYIRL